jgi:hypothetical protein
MYNKKLIQSNKAFAVLHANAELILQNEEKGKRTIGLIIANKVPAIQNEEKGKHLKL